MGQLAGTDSGRGEAAAGRDSLSPRLSAFIKTRTQRALAACVCALALCASSSPALRAQSGRASQVKKGEPSGSPTPTPTPVRPVEGPIAEPPSPNDPKAKVRKAGGIRPAGTTAQAPK